YTAGDIDVLATAFGTLPTPDPTVDGAPSVCREEQSNTCIVFWQQAVLKIFRRVERGLNPDVELPLFLHRHGFRHVPPILGSLEYRGRRAEPATLAVVETFVPNEGSAWQATLDELSRFFERALTLTGEPEPLPPFASLLDLTKADLSPRTRDLL